MSLREAAEKALEALEWVNRYGSDEHGPSTFGAEHVLREALAEPESNEPVAWLEFRENLPPLVVPRDLGTPVYTHPVDDTALLRQALEALVFVDGDYETIKVLRERLGEKK
jgi:hypothetical protein